MGGGMVGDVGWVIYVVDERDQVTDIFSAVIGAFVVVELSYFLAKTRRAHVTVFLISGIIPLVPGRGLYRTM